MIVWTFGDIVDIALAVFLVVLLLIIWIMSLWGGK